MSPLAHASVLTLHASGQRHARLMAWLSALVVLISAHAPSAAAQQVEPGTAPTTQTIDASDTTNSNSEANAVVGSASLGEEIAVRAIALIGTRYRYGGADLNGFDCSGMVFYIHQALGFTVPRTAADQHNVADPITREQLQPGDLLFFQTSRRKRISHVGIYVGDNRFVHAPQTGKRIELRSIDDEYYGRRFISAGRLHPSS